jgi:NADH dehydrogenase
MPAAEAKAGQASAPVAVFGATGFVGCRIVARLLDAGIRVRAVCRHPQRLNVVLRRDARDLEPMTADILDQRSIEPALRGCRAVVNAVSLYVEGGGATFHAVHVDGAAGLARACRRHGVERFVQMSGIGADAGSDSRYIRARGEGELAVRAEHDGAVIVRPTAMFGTGDALLTTLVRLVRRLPVFPLFGRGRTRLQPVSVDNVADATVRIVLSGDAPETVYELGGPEVFTYRELVERVAMALSLRRLLVPVPFSFWKAMATMAEGLPSPALTVHQVELMKLDNVAGGPGLDRLGVEPAAVEGVLADIVAAGRRRTD